jgi:hypothetical protein
MPINPTYLEAETVQASGGKYFSRLHLQNNQSKMKLEVWLK